MPWVWLRPPRIIWKREGKVKWYAQVRLGGALWKGPRRRGDAQGKSSDEEDLEYIFKSWQQKTAKRRITDDDNTERGRQWIGDAQGKHSDEEDLEDIFAGWHQNTANRRMIDAEAQAVAEATTVASSHKQASTPSTKKKHPTMSGKGPLRFLSCQARVCQLVFYGATTHLMSVSLSRRWSSV